MKKKLLNLGIGLVTGIVGGKIISSQATKKLVISTVAGGLKVKEGLDRTIENIKVSTEDIVAEAKIKKEQDKKAEEERKAQLNIEKIAEDKEDTQLEEKEEEVKED